MGGLCSAACLRHTPLSPSHTQQATRRELQSPCVSACQTFTWRQHSQQNSNTLRARHEAGPRRTPRHGSRAGVVSQTSSGARIRPADLPRSSSFQLNTRSAAAPRACRTVVRGCRADTAVRDTLWSGHGARGGWSQPPHQETDNATGPRSTPRAQRNRVNIYLKCIPSTIPMVQKVWFESNIVY